MDEREELVRHREEQIHRDLTDTTQTLRFREPEYDPQRLQDITYEPMLEYKMSADRESMGFIEDRHYVPPVNCTDLARQGAVSQSRRLDDGSLLLGWESVVSFSRADERNFQIDRHICLKEGTEIDNERLRNAPCPCIMTRLVQSCTAVVFADHTKQHFLFMHLDRHNLREVLDSLSRQKRFMPGGTLFVSHRAGEDDQEEMDFTSSLHKVFKPHTFIDMPRVPGGGESEFYHDTVAFDPDLVMHGDYALGTRTLVKRGQPETVLSRKGGFAVNIGDPTSAVHKYQK